MDKMEKLIKHLKRVEKNTAIKADDNISKQVNKKHPEIGKLLRELIALADVDIREKNEIILYKAGYAIQFDELKTSKGIYTIP